MIMKEKVISIEFTGEELTDLIEELMCVEKLITKVLDRETLDLHKDKTPEMQEIYLRMHKNRVKFLQDMIDKLLPYDPFLTASMQ